MFNKYELAGAGISVVCMVTALYLVQTKTNLALLSNSGSNLAQVSQSGTVKVNDGEDVNQTRADAIKKAIGDNGNLKDMVIEDVKVGTGDEVKSGDTVSVNYIGTLQDGTEFDNSYKRGQPFSFTVGGKQVIKGWDEGLVGMKVGGQRILVIPPDKAYGASKAGPIPANSTLVFAIELMEIK